MLADCPARVIEFLATQASPTLRRVIWNPSVPDAVKAAIARRATGYPRTALVRELRGHDDVSAWLVLSGVFTAASLRKAIRPPIAPHRPAVPELMPLSSERPR